MPLASFPLSINPSQSWEGNDGPWSTFYLGFGTPAQYIRVLVSLTAVQPWVVLPQGCIPTDPADCYLKRGVFYPSESTTWKDQGFYTLYSEENLGYNSDDNGDFGYETISLGLNGSGLPVIEHQILVGIATKDFYLGIWGVGPRPTNLTSLDNPIPSLMTTLRQRNLVPSISYGYTAGAQYRLQGVLGSLTLGGYDASRFFTNDVSFNFSGYLSRDLLVGLQSMTVTGLNSSQTPVELLPSGPILSFIDAGVSHIWLPIDACNAIQQIFGLQYDPITEIYLINATQRTKLIAQNPNVTMTIGADVSSTKTVDIVFPYQAFDLILTTDYPGINMTTHYFPIRRAANQTQYTLGRTFLQEAYVVADYERYNFSVYPCQFSDSMPQDLRAIPSLQATNSSLTPTPSPSHPPSPGIIAAIAVVAVAICSILAGALFAWRRRRRQRQSALDLLAKGQSKEAPNFPELEPGKERTGELHENVRLPPELSSSEGARPELRGCAAGHEVDGGIKAPTELPTGEIHELEGAVPEFMNHRSND